MLGIRIAILFLLISSAQAVEISRGMTKKMQELPVLFIADNQFNNFLTDPNTLRSTFIDNVVMVAIRPPQLDLFAPDISTYSLEKNGKNKYVIHLGDALNIACQNEWKKQIDTFYPFQNGKQVHKGWVLVPGNHDAFYYGNTQGSTYNSRGSTNKAWKDSCNSASYPPPKDGEIKDVVMSKDILTKKYMKELFRQAKHFPQDFPKQEDIKCTESKKATRNRSREKRTKIMSCDYQSKNPGSLVQKIHYTYPTNQDIRVAYRSHIVQEINLDLVPKAKLKLKAIFLDTSDFMSAPRTIAGALGAFLSKRTYNAGMRGNITKEQTEVVKNWLKNADKNTTYLFMGHHPYKMFSKESKKRFKELQKLAPESVYISSHTHEGFINYEGPVKEINVGSITDYPNEVATLHFDFTNKGVLSVYPKRIRDSFEDVSPDGFCAPSDNYTKRGNPHFRYMSYKDTQTTTRMHDVTLDTILVSLYRAYEKLNIFKKEMNPTLMELYNKMQDIKPCNKGIPRKREKCRSEKFNFVKRVLKYDKTLYKSKKYRENRIRYGVCQSYWASYIEWLKDWEKVPYDI